VIQEAKVEERDYYEVLQLHSSADHAMVVQAYWHLARKYKNAMDGDAFAERALEELNRSFDILGCPESRAAYDEARAVEQRGDEAVEPETKRVSIEVCFWNLPAWQGILAASATIALAVIALTSGTPLMLVAPLAGVAALAALLALPSALGSHRMPFRQRWSRRIRAVELERSTAQAVARWRRANGESQKAVSLLDLADSDSHFFYPDGNSPVEF
jgi:curved DNA-binding protein CbpA